MEKWTGRVALVTGASAGIGAAISVALVKAGLTVVGAARSEDRIKKLAAELTGQKGTLNAFKCDLTKDEEVYDLFKYIKNLYGGVDLCINNAGLNIFETLLDGTPENWRYMMDLNVISYCLCTKLAVASMRERGVDDGHVINISSKSGHYVPPNPKVHFYSGTKFALRAITEGLRQELREAKSHIRISAVSPGLVETKFAYKMFNDPKVASDYYASLKCLEAEDVASTVLHIIASPPHVEINDVIMRPTEQAI